MASKPPAHAHVPANAGPPGDDFEEDTLLPPPAPGLLLPTADHGFDPPTFPGMGSPLRTGPQAARLMAQAPGATPMTAADLVQPEPSPRSLIVEHSSPPAPRELDGDPDPTPHTATLTSDLEGQTADALPPLPRAPRQGTGTATALAMLSYLFRVTWNRWQRKRITARVEAGLRNEAATLDRLLADLGQHAYIEQVDLWALFPPHGDENAPALAQVPQTPAESWAVRIDAEQLRTLALLTREEARLTSELLQCVELRRRDVNLTEEPAMRDEFELLLGRLAAVRIERWVQERARAHCQRHHAQLLSTLEHMLVQRAAHSGIRRMPNLLLLGSLVASQRTLSSTRAIEPWFSTIPGRPAGIEISPALFQPLWRFQDGLLSRAILCARALVERYAYDEELVDRALIFVTVVAVTALLVFAIAFWAISI